MKKPTISLIWIVVAVLAIGLIPVVTKSVTLRETVFIMLMYIALASSLNILLGYTGYVSFGHIVFYGIGGHVAISLIEYYGFSIIPAMILAGIFSAIIAYALGQADRKSVV